ncbi:MAG TPA: hypothetical protein VGD75_23005, partial [Bradyrhizobium sp.]
MNISARPTLNILGVCVLVYALYLPIALWLQHSYVPLPDAPPPPRPGKPWPLQAIHPYGGSAFHAHVDAFESLADDNADQQHSPVVLYEDDKPLEPAHSVIADVVRNGRGRYTHWKGVGMIFSTSDNTNPTRNGRH